MDETKPELERIIPRSCPFYPCGFHSRGTLLPRANCFTTRNICSIHSMRNGLHRAPRAKPLCF
jgi:hypothetical protein